jgi:DNA-3-methyladenine glycosylase II
VIKSNADIGAGVAALRAVCPVIRGVHDRVGDPPLRRHAAGFPGLAQIVVAQQLSAASAGAIWARTATAVDPFDAARLLATGDATLRAAGLSGGKVRTLRAVADAVVAKRLSFDRRLDDEALRAQLLAINGIGPWTADIYLMFCLGRADAFAAGDLALQMAAQRAFALDQKPSANELVELSDRWRPWRGVAARLLWAFHVWREPTG